MNRKINLASSTEILDIAVSAAIFVKLRAAAKIREPRKEGDVSEYKLTVQVFQG